MPHIIVEYSENLAPKLDIAPLLQDLHTSISGMHNVALDRIKTRAYAAPHFIVGDQGTNAGFVHVQLRLMPGRSDDQKTDLSGRLLAATKKYIDQIQHLKTSITIEVAELHGPSYRP